MKAVVWHGVGRISLDEVADPKIQDPTDAIVEITASALCGTDLHFVRGTMSGMVEGTILGHEAVGVVREVGAGVRNLRPGDRVVVPSTIGCGTCSYTQVEDMPSVIDAYESFDERQTGWTKVALDPGVR
jgi:threonine dehydrogenase-like Zn-dependent dehydrogenase